MAKSNKQPDLVKAKEKDLEQQITMEQDIVIQINAKAKQVEQAKANQAEYTKKRQAFELELVELGKQRDDILKKVEEDKAQGAAGGATGGG